MLKRKRVLALLLSLTLAVSPVVGNMGTVRAEEAPAVELLAAENAPGNLALTQVDGGMKITWDSYNNAASYDIYRANSRYGNYTLVDTVNGLTYTDTKANADKYANYYKVAVAGSTDLSDPISLEIEMFGEDMYVFSPEDDLGQIYDVVDAVYQVQGSVDENGDAHDGQQFGDGRYAFAFKPGDYSDRVYKTVDGEEQELTHFNMSYYMQMLGLGKIPTEVKIRNVHVPPVLPDWNVTCNFWMGIENLTIAGEEDTSVYSDAWFNFMWSVSQAAPARRLYVQRPTSLNFMWNGWASGGYIADSVFEQAVGSWSQQQYYLRNSKMPDFYGVNWNLVMQGCTGMTNGENWKNTVAKFPMYELESGLGETNWESGGKYTVLDSTDAVREKPFLYFDEDEKEYKVYVPGFRKNAIGVSWSEASMGNGVSVDISNFYIARADRDNAASINAALEAGKSIILSPGIYHAEEPIRVEKANTIVLGLGLATIIPTNEEAAMTVADVGGVSIAGVVLDADSYSKNMLVVGEEGCNKDHSANPTVLQDVIVRVGGVHGGVASTDEAIVINSNDVIGDHFWIWRADHGAGVGWDLNKAKNGMVVNGDDVTLYGLMVEHFQEYDVIWRGENGKNYFLQNEKCYDPQNQADWMSHDGTKLGYAAYKVANNVKNHYAVGMGSYDVFIYTNGASIFLDNAYEIPDTEGVKVENICIVEIANESGPAVGFNNIINDTGAAISTGEGGGGYARQAVLSYCNNKSVAMEDYYVSGGNESGNVAEEEGTAPTDDPDAEKEIIKDEPSVDTNEKNIIDAWKDAEGGVSDDYTPVIGTGSVATGPYAQWKNNAVTSPAKGQLVAAGLFDIEFSQLAEAVKYDVYVDNKLVKTFEGAQAQAATYKVEVKSVEVQKHTTYVIATLTDGTTVTSNIRNFYISKKGIGIWQDDYEKIDEMNLSWYYTWSPYELTGVSEAVDFVPMIWGDEEDTRSQDRKNEWAWLRAGGYKDYRYLLTFNEPDFTDQSHMTPERAVELWPEMEAISDEGTIVSSPVVAIPTVFYDSPDNDYGVVGGWYGKYEQLMATYEYHDDFTAVHFYFDYPGAYVLDIFEQIHKKTGKPLWITEWGVGQWSQVQPFDWTGGPDEGNWQRTEVVNFVNEIIPQMDEIDYIERYAWFPFDGSNTEKYGNGAGGLFFCGENDPLKGQLTAVGKAYRDVGNPYGWDPDVVTEDNVVIDGTNSDDGNNNGGNNNDGDNDDGNNGGGNNGGGDNDDGDNGGGNDDDANVRGNVLAGKTATASSTQGGNVAGNAIDANAASRWESVASEPNPQWIQIDLGETYTVDAFKIVWETAAAKEYKIQVSVDGVNWEDAYTVTDGVSGETREDTFAAKLANYIRVEATSKTTDYGYSIFEMEVMGVKGDHVDKEDSENEPTVAVTGVTLNKNTLSLEESGYERLTATVAPATASNQNVTWKSSNDAVATVTGDGLVYAVKAGTAVITVTTEDGAKTASCNVTVTAPAPVAVSGISVSKTELTLETNVSEQVTVKVTPDNASNKKVTWTASNDNVTVEANGIITGKKVGDATVTVTTEDGNYSAQIQVTVVERAEGSVAVEGVELVQKEITMYEGDTSGIDAVFAPANPTNKGIFWDTTDSEVVFVSSEGELIARKAGTATITAKTADGGYTAQCTVTVLPIAVEGVSLNKTASELEVGISEQLLAIVAPSNASNQNVTWKSSDDTVAKVDANGLVTALKTGKATITATTEERNKTATCEITVVARAEGSVTVTGITLNKDTLTVQEGALDDTLVATITPATATNKTVIWSSANKNVAVVEAGVVYARSAGTAVITAMTADGAKEASCVVTVTKRPEGAVAVAGVKLDTNMLDMTVGDKKQLTATVLPENAENKDVSYKVLTEGVVTVDDNGLVTAVAAGMTVITVTTADGGYSTACAVIVNEAKKDDAGTGSNNQPVVKPGTTVTPGTTVKPGTTTPVVTTPAYVVGTVFNYGKFQYKVTNATEGSLKVELVKPLKKTNTSVKIPATVTYKNKKFAVTSIAKKAFANNKKLKKVVIGSNVTTIGIQAFAGCKKLTNVTVGKSVTSIGSKAFFKCTKLKKVIFKGKSVKKIGKSAFVKTSKSIVFKTGNKKMVKKYRKLLKKKAPASARVMK